MIGECPVIDGGMGVPMSVTALVQRMEAHDIILDRKGSDDWQRINLIERELAEMPQQEMPLNHVFAPGQYARSIFIPAGTLATTRIHLHGHVFVLSLGSVSTWEGCKKGWQFMGSPHIGTTSPGTRRIVYAHQDTIWTTMHLNPRDETDPDKLVDDLTFDPTKLRHLDSLSPERLSAVQCACREKKAVK